MTDKKQLNEDNLKDVAGGVQHATEYGGVVFTYADAMTSQYDITVDKQYCICKKNKGMVEFGVCKAVWEEPATCGTNRKATFYNRFENKTFDIYVDEDKDGYQCFECYKWFVS